MAQLLVRKLDPALVARQGGSTTDEAHRRILREALMGPADAFQQALLAIPAADDDEADPFPRDRSLPRIIET